MSEEKTTLELYLGMILAISHAANYKDILFNRIKRDAEEIEKLNSIIDELRDEKANMQTGFYQMVERGGFDISPCRNCGESLVCIPEGLALCRTCAAKGGDA